MNKHEIKDLRYHNLIKLAHDTLQFTRKYEQMDSKDKTIVKQKEDIPMPSLQILKLRNKSGKASHSITTHL